MPDCTNALSDLGLPRTRLRIANRVYKADQDHALMVMLTATNWVLQRLPGMVQADQREVVETLAAARDLVVEVHVRRQPAVLIRDGSRALVKILAR
jgi:hypothetical protein